MLVLCIACGDCEGGKAEGIGRGVNMDGLGVGNALELELLLALSRGIALRCGGSFFGFAAVLRCECEVEVEGPSCLSSSSRSPSKGVQSSSPKLP